MKTKYSIFNERNRQCDQSGFFSGFRGEWPLTVGRLLCQASLSWVDQKSLSFSKFLLLWTVCHDCIGQRCSGQGERLTDGYRIGHLVHLIINNFLLSFFFNKHLVTPRTKCTVERNGNPLQYSSLENPRDGGA